MKVFNKLVFICNICFIISVIMRLVEKSSKAQGNGAVSALPPVQGILVVLGYGAIFINLIFVLTFVILSLKGKQVLPKWIAYLNIIMFFVQIWYFFFSKF